MKGVQGDGGGVGGADIGRGRGRGDGIGGNEGSRPSSGRHRRGQRRGLGHRWRHSLRARLVTVFVLLALAMAAVFVLGMQRAFSHGWRDTARPLIGDYVDRMVADLGSPPDPAKARALADRLPIAVAISGPGVEWASEPSSGSWRGTGRFGPRGGDWLTRTTADGYRVSFGPAATSWRHGSNGLALATLGILVALVVATYVYVRRLLRPIDDIRAGAERFGAGRFDEPIVRRSRDELGELAGRINTMARDIEAMLDGKRALLLALSHELRSPLTRARLNAELLPELAETAKEREALLKDLGEMRDLIADILESERLASPHAALQREPTNVESLVRGVLGERADSGAVRLRVVGHPTPLPIDPTRVRLLMRNLLDNALRHGAAADVRPGGDEVSNVGAGDEPGSGGARVDVEIAFADARDADAQDGDTPPLTLTVRDYGPGVDDAVLTRLSEPFYRPDAARERSTGGVGLGLHLCRLIAEAHGGDLSIDNARPGLRVAVRLR